MTQTGVYLGNDPRALAAYTGFMGASPDNVLFYLNNDSWSAFDSSIGWAVNLWKPGGVPVIWSVPLTVWGTSLDQVATGAYDGHFLKAAAALANAKPSADGSIYVRVGWEFNGGWMPWAAEGREAAFIESFRTLVDAFRSVSDKFKFVWDVNAGGSYDPAKAYPGDAYVDVIGMDRYYSNQWDSPDPLAAFRAHVSQPYGLQWQQDFAARHGKPTAISEWGVESDRAGPYVEAMARWMEDHGMVFANYWESDMANFDGRMHTGQFPNASKAYKAAIIDLQTPDPNIALPPAGFVPPATAAADAPADPGSPEPPADEPSTLVLRVSGDGFEGSPEFRVLVDGQQVGGVMKATASHRSGEWQEFTLQGGFGPDPKQVAVEFLNDRWGGTWQLDRNLYVDWVSLNGTRQEAEAQARGGSALWGDAALYSNGALLFDFGADTLVLRVAQDEYQGDARFVVRVDGRQVGDVQTARADYASGAWDEITLRGEFGDASRVTVEFLNDHWGGWGMDRNLYVDRLTLNGRSYEGEAAAEGVSPRTGDAAGLYSNGTLAFDLDGPVALSQGFFWS